MATMGAITGVPLGAAQAFLLHPRVPHAWTWAVAMPVLWALGWTVTTTAGIDVERRYAVFGAARSLTPPAGRTLPEASVQRGHHDDPGARRSAASRSTDRIQPALHPACTWFRLP
jgi:hypothetical protein